MNKPSPPSAPHLAVSDKNGAPAPSQAQTRQRFIPISGNPPQGWPAGAQAHPRAKPTASHRINPLRKFLAQVENND